MIENMKDLVEIREGQIVSRSIDKKLGISHSATLLAVAKGESISQEISSNTKLIQILEGSLKINLNQTPFLLNEGSFIVVHKEEVYSLKAIQNCKYLLLDLD